MKRFGLVVVLCLSASASAGVAFERPECARASSNRFFFPAGILGQRTKQYDGDRFMREWYSMHLRVMAEPSLSCKAPAAETYRFLWLRSFHPSIAVRIESNSDGATLSAAQLTGNGGYRPGKVATRVQKRLSADEWKSISDGLATIEFWSIPVRDPGLGGFDGARWILEGRKGQQYHVVDRWSPESGAYRDFCLSLLRTAGLLPSGEDARDSIY